jgi:large subunit ribosomal protein L18
LIDKKIALRERRHRRVRYKVVGSAERPRLAVFKSNSHMYAQVIDDGLGHTIASASTLDAELKEIKGGKGNVVAAKMVGELVARRAKAKGVAAVVFDKGGFKYHGRVKALADSARDAGLKF